MNYCKIILKQVPTPIFAHTYESAHYDYILPKSPNEMEISFIEQGAVNVWKNGKLIDITPEQSFAVNFNKEEIRCSSDAPLHRHITVGISAEYEMIPISEEQVIACSREAETHRDSQEVFAILPMKRWTNLSQGSKLPNMIREIIRAYPDASAANRLYLNAQIMRLLSEITQESVRQSFVAKQIPPGNILCVQKAMRYISENIQRKIMVDEIAEAVNLSPGYLSNVFKTVTGQTLTEYINRTKLKIVRELVLNGQMTFAQAGEYVGITDSSYLSRLFRRYMDTTIQKLRKDHNIISE